MRTSWLFPLAAAAHAKRHAFSIHDDVLAFPQFAITYSSDPVSELQAQSRLISNARLDLDLSSSSSDDDTKALDAPSESASHKLEYELLTLQSKRYLCSIPQVDEALEPDDNSTSKTAAEEAAELVAANDRGWELLQDLQGQCLYYWAGWWSYRFCYDGGVKQFHQMQARPGLPAHPPMEDTSVTGFMLGTVEGSVARLKKEAAKMQGLERTKAIGRIEVRGESRYLFQRLRGGDVCDLTGEDRMIEVQFHCNPASQDSIAMIKEVATCSYLMMIDTPRLCNDVAFAPPEKGTVHPITCHPIVSAADHAAHEARVEAAKQAEQAEQADQARVRKEAAMSNPFVSGPGDAPKRVGDVVVGAHKWISSGQKLEKSAIVGGGGGDLDKFIETIADSMGKKMDAEELKKLGLGDPKVVEKLRKQLDSIAGEKKWKLDVFDTPQGREYRGVIDDTEGGKKDNAENAKDGKEQKAEPKDVKTGDKKGEAAEGSEETYKGKDEL